MAILKTSVDAILGEFSKTIERLGAHAEDQTREAAKHEEFIQKATAKKTAAELETKRANAVKAKLQALLSGD